MRPLGHRLYTHVYTIHSVIYIQFIFQNIYFQCHTYFFWEKSFPELGLTHLAWPCCLASSGELPDSITLHWTIYAHHNAWLLTYVLRTRPQVPMLMQQVLLQQSHVPSLLYTAKDVGSVGHVPPEPGDLLWVLFFLPSPGTWLRWGSSHFLGRLGLFNVVYSSPSKPLHGPVEPSFFQWVAFCCQPL